MTSALAFFFFGSKGVSESSGVGGEHFGLWFRSGGKGGGGGDGQIKNLPHPGKVDQMLMNQVEAQKNA